MNIVCFLPLLNQTNRNTVKNILLELIPDAKVTYISSIENNFTSYEILLCDETYLNQVGFDTIKFFFQTHDTLKAVFIHSSNKDLKRKEEFEDGIIATFQTSTELKTLIKYTLSTFVEKKQTNKAVNNDNNESISTNVNIPSIDHTIAQNKNSIDQIEHSVKKKEKKEKNYKEPDEVGKGEDNQEKKQEEKKEESTNEIELKIERFKKEIGIAKLDENKTIAVWSPIPKVGVTEFVTNFSIYLANQGIELCVLESITNRPKLKRQLRRYSKKPDNWYSYPYYLFEKDKDPKNCKWLYQSLHWFPCDYKDSEFPWSKEKIYEYLRGLKHYDLTLIDLPTGLLNPISLEVLNHVDELWIVCNQLIDEWMEWGEYMIDLKNHVPNIFTIFNAKHRLIPSPKAAIEKDLQFPLLAELPALFEVRALSEFSTSPLILDEKVLEQWENPFQLLQEHTLNKRKTLYRRKSAKPSILERLSTFFHLEKGRIS